MWAKQKLLRFEKAEDKRIRTFDSERLFFSSPDKFNDLFDVVVDSLSDITHLLFDEERMKYALAVLYQAPFKTEWPLSDDFMRLVYMWLASDSEFKVIGETTDSDYEMTVRQPSIDEDELKKAITLLFKNIPVCCFFKSEVCDPLMWAHYADQHNGYCVEYEVGVVGPNFFTLPVSYTTAKKSMNPLKFLMDPVLETERALSTKGHQWAHEKEVRLVSKLGHTGENQLPKGMKPTSVYIGYHMRDQQPKMFYHLIEVAERKGMKIYIMTANKTSMTLTPTPWSTVKLIVETKKEH